MKEKSEIVEKVEKAPTTGSKPSAGKVLEPKQPAGAKPTPEQKPKPVPKPTAAKPTVAKPTAAKPTQVKTPKPTKAAKPTKLPKPTKAPRPTKAAKPTAVAKATKVGAGDEKAAATAVPTIGGEGPVQAPVVECPQRCKKIGTLQSNFCANDFVLAGTVKAVVKVAGQGVYATVSISTIYKEGSLSVQQAGESMSVKLLIQCPRCHVLKRGGNYVFMGQVSEEGKGTLTPDSFVVLYKVPQQKILAAISKRGCRNQAKRGTGSS